MGHHLQVPVARLPVEGCLEAGQGPEGRCQHVDVMKPAVEGEVPPGATCACHLAIVAAVAAGVKPGQAWTGLGDLYTLAPETEALTQERLGTRGRIENRRSSAQVDLGPSLLPGLILFSLSLGRMKNWKRGSK